PRIEKEYTRAWQIFFNTFQKVDSRQDPEKVNAEGHAKAEAAWKRLEAGEEFGTVAREVSEDQMSRGQGGSLGFIAKTAYGGEFRFALTRLKAGEISRPFKSAYGYHIIKWAPIREEDLLTISKVGFITNRTEALLAQIAQTAKVVRY